MKKLVIGIFLTMFLSSAFANEPEIKSDKDVACAVILCLSTASSRPSECTPPIRKYLSIKAKHFTDTLTKRKNFLKMCPDEKGDLNTPINLIVNASERCTASALNFANRRIITIANPEKQQCRKRHPYSAKSSCDTYPDYVKKTIIQNHIPQICAEWIKYQDGNALHYEGDVMNGGHFVD